MIGVRAAELGFRAERLGLVIESRGGRHLLQALEGSRYGEIRPRLIYLLLQNAEAKWTRPAIACHQAKAQFAIHFEDRFVLSD